ncbi:MAG: histidine phosphatase family protein [Alphaproteobacteria bacterium]|nr:histidine phosphatase family protein [Alphaproteobacteria bacterium]
MHGVRPLIESGFLFLRHGQSESNVDGLIGGATDYALTEAGREQARAAGERLLGHAITAIYSSPLSRAFDTAQMVAEAMGGVTIEVYDDLRERNLGVWEGQPVSVYERDVTPDGGESVQSFRQRVVASLEKIAAPPTALLVAHAGVFRILHQHLAGGDYAGRAKNAHPMMFEPDADAWRVDPL